MKSIEFIDETLRGSNFDSVAQKFGEMNKDRWATGNHIGDIEQYQVKHLGIYYSVWDKDKLIAFTSLTESDNEVDNCWVSEDYRGQKLFSKLLWFYKTRLGRSPLRLGKVHSKTMQEVVNGLIRFKKSWLNVDTNEVIPFDLTTVDSYYSWYQITPWRLILENNGDFSDWPKFTDGSSFIYESYTPYID